MEKRPLARFAGTNKCFIFPKIACSFYSFAHIICDALNSGLVGKVALEDLQNSYVVVVVNLKPADLRGVMSAGMVLAASEGDKVTNIISFSKQLILKNIFINFMLSLFDDRIYIFVCL